VAGGEFSLPAISKTKRRGRGDARHHLMRGMEDAWAALRFLYHRAWEGVPWWWLLQPEEDGDRGVGCCGPEGRWA
jgi:hypothetical protein